MASRLDFVLNLIDKVSGPAYAAGQSLETVNKLMDMAGRKSEVTASRMSRSFQRSRIHANGLLGVIRGLLGALTSLPALAGAGALGFGAFQMFDAMAFKESTLASMKIMLRSAEKAGSMFAGGMKIAKLTPFSERDVADAYKGLLRAGFTRAEVPIAFQGIGDVAALNGFDKTILGRLTTVFQQIRSTGKLQGDELNQLGDAGIPVIKVYEKLAKRLGVTKSKIIELKEKGKIGAGLAIWGIFEAIREMSGGKLGNVMLEQSKTIKGLWSTLKGVPDGIFMRLVPTEKEMRMMPERFKGFLSLKRFLKSAVDATSEDGTIGKVLFGKVRDGLDKILQTAFGGLDAALEPKRIGAAIDKTVAFVNRLIRWWKKNGPTIVSFAVNVGRGIGDAFKLIGRMWNFVRPAVEGIAGFVGRLLGLVNAGGKSSDVLGRLLGLAMGLFGAFTLLNLVTFGAAGAVVGMLVGFWRLIAIFGLLNTLTGGLAGRVLVSLLGVLGRVAMAIGGTLVRAFLMAIGPIGWAVLALMAIGAALVWAYKKVGWFRDGVNAAWEGIKTAGAGILAWFEGLPERLAKVGPKIIQGIASGLADGSLIHSALDLLTGGMVRKFADLLGIKSPSRVFAALGKQLPAGLAVGVNLGTGKATRALRSLGAAATVTMATAMPAVAGPVAPAAGAAHAGGARPPIHITVTVPVHGGASRVDAAAIESAVRSAMGDVVGELELLLMEDGYDG